jgi:hypothetical protein
LYEWPMSLVIFNNACRVCTNTACPEYNWSVGA